MLPAVTTSVVVAMPDMAAIPRVEEVVVAMASRAVTTTTEVAETRATPTPGNHHSFNNPRIFHFLTFFFYNDIDGKMRVVAMVVMTVEAAVAMAAVTAAIDSRVVTAATDSRVATAVAIAAVAMAVVAMTVALPMVVEEAVVVTVAAVEVVAAIQAVLV